MSFDDDDTETLDLVLGQTHHLLGQDGDEHAQRLVEAATLRVQPDGGFYYPMPGDNWTDRSYEAVLQVDPKLTSEFTEDVVSRVWQKLEAVLRGRQRSDVFGLVVEASVPPLPEVTADWRDRAAEQAVEPRPVNQALVQRDDAAGRFPQLDGLLFASRPEIIVYEALVAFQRACPRPRTIAIAPLAAVKMRDSGVRSPDFVVIGNGRAVVIEVDGPHHYGVTRKADDADRDRHWSRCGVHTIRISAQHTEEPAALAALLREELQRWLQPRP